jgi:hypothetical protein
LVRLLERFRKALVISEHAAALSPALNFKCQRLIQRNERRSQDVENRRRRRAVARKLSYCCAVDGPICDLPIFFGERGGSSVSLMLLSICPLARS